MIEIVKARFANPEQNIILVQYKSEEDGYYEMYVDVDSPESAELNAAGWDNKKIFDSTVQWKIQESGKLVEVAKKAASDEYKERLDQLRKQYVEAQAMQRKHEEDMRKYLERHVAAEAMAKKTEQEMKVKIKKLDAFFNASLSEEDKEKSFEKVIEFLSNFEKDDVTQRLKEAKLINGSQHT